jgi:cyclohexyl-isocyanide hydratase
MRDTEARKWPLMAMGPDMTGAPPMHVAMLVFPGLTLLDLIGPQTALHGPMVTHLLWKTRDAVESDTGICINPTMSFAEAPGSFDILFVPGGPGMVQLFDDDEVLGFLAHHGARARWVTAVCTGSMILGVAGLLRGYRATTHWAGHEVLPLFGAEPVRERVVFDRNRITAGGVTSGIDFGLMLLDTIYGSDVARTTQLLMEYDPAPPFDAGSVEAAGPDIAARAMQVLSPAAERSLAALEARFGDQKPT